MTTLNSTDHRGVVLAPPFLGGFPTVITLDSTVQAAGKLPRHFSDKTRFDAYKVQANISFLILSNSYISSSTTIAEKLYT